VINFAPLKPYFLSVYQGAYTYMPGVTGAPPLMAPINRKGDQVLPSIVFNLQSLRSQLESAYPLVTAGKFSEAHQVFLITLYKAVLAVVEKKDANEVRLLINRRLNQLFQNVRNIF
jgi:coatomer protein complex subunit alpha (xenin)